MEEIMSIATEKSAIKKIEFCKVIRITSSIYRFYESCKHKDKLPVLVKANETEKNAKVFWIKHEKGKTYIKMGQQFPNSVEESKTISQ